jgi:large subunit ribosomal protein L23
LVTEKSNIAREEMNVVTLAVNPRATKYDIRNAVESLFGVQVLEVHTMRQPRKSKKVGKFTGRKPEWKKAIVRLAEGQSIEFFEGV